MNGALALAAVLGLAAVAEVYRWVDQDGTVHFTDQPCPGAERTTVEPAPAIDLDAPTARPQGWGGAHAEPTLVPDYRVAIANLQDGETVWNDARELVLELAVEPSLALARGHRLEVSVDGTVRATDLRATHVVLADIDRGTHSVQARVVDRDGTTLAESGRLIIHHRQHSLGTR